MIDLHRNAPRPAETGRGIEADIRNDSYVHSGKGFVNGLSLFSALFDGCQGFINIRSIRRGEPTRSEFYPIEDLQWLQGVVDKYYEYNLYFGIATRERGNGKKDGIIHIPAVWGDIDFKNTPREKADKLISDLPVKPSVIIESGGGYHLYWFLKEPAGAEEIPMVEVINKKLASFLVADSGVCDASHILRIPGTLNHKYNPARPVTVKDFTGTRYNLEDFECLPEAQEKRDDEYVGKGPGKDKLLVCDFIRWCNNRPREVSEPLWYAMVSNVAHVSPGGPQFVHNLSRDYPGYSKKETDEKILHALNASGPHTCKYIKENGFDCTKDCGVKSPINLLMSSGDSLKGRGQNGPVPSYSPLTIEDFLSLSLPERGHIIKPVIPEQGLVMVYGPRGNGKTWFVLQMAYGIASGGQIVNHWQASKPRRVLYIDGEMPARTMQERIASIVAGSEEEPPDPSYLSILTPDLQDMAMPNLAHQEGQEAIADLIRDTEVVIVDNLACLARHGRENDSESWLPVQTWLLGLRRQGKSVITVHHAGKGGAQRGTSSREDVLDTVISLRRPKDYDPSEGARFEVHLEKARGVYGQEAAPFEAALRMENGVAIWVCRSLEDSVRAQILALKAEEYSIRDIANETVSLPVLKVPKVSE